jgi:NAD(P)-dependent dehydrogenase (short-subunit alcohol dehydrogenase family)
MQTDPFRIDGRVALITGGTQGVGAAIAKSFARAGADVLIHGLRSDAAAQQTINACTAFGTQSEGLFLDLLAPSISNSPSSAANELFRMAIDANPRIDLLVNNAGTYLDRRFVDLDDDTYYRTMQLNVATGLFLTRAFASYWIEHGTAGRVLFTGSINGLLAEPQHAVYDTSKGAVAAMVRSLCVELAPHGIRVNSVAPGLVLTPLTRQVGEDPKLLHWMQRHTPCGRVPDAEVCGPPAVFLMSDAAEHIHGQTLYVDGGMSTWQQPDCE